MENASKALIMAGAILIAILIISAGLIILNSTEGTIKQSQKATEAIEIETFNSQFTKYCGDKVLGSKVKNLQNFVASYNSANNTSVTLTVPTNAIIPNKYYKVYIPDTGYSEGYVVSIVVEEISN